MYRHILKIGNAKYTFNQAALCAFVAEARLRRDAADAEASAPAGCGPAAALRPVYEEVDGINALYRAYRSTDSVELLLQLKSRLEQVSVRYGSHALAEEVLSINSCLPYERRVPAGP